MLLHVHVTQAQAKMVASAEQELHVCTSSLLQFIQSTMTSLEQAFKAPEVKAALSEWVDKEDQLKQKTEQCNADSETALEELDIEKAEQLEQDLQHLKQQLWNLIECKLVRLNQEEGTGRQHFVFQAESEQLKSQIESLSTEFQQHAANCAKDKAELDVFGEQQNSFEQSQAVVDVEQDTKLQTAAVVARAECEEAEQRLKEAMLGMEKAYDHENTVLKAQQQHQVLVEARTTALNQEREWLQKQLRNSGQVKRAAEASTALLGDCNGEFTHLHPLCFL